MKVHLRQHGLGYLVALGATAGVVLLRWLLGPVVGDFLPLATLYGAVAFAVWFGGYRPALLAVALVYLAGNYLFIEFRRSFGFHEGRNFVGLILYLFSCAIIIGFGEAMRVSRRRFEELTRQQDQLSPPTSAGIEAIRRKHSLRDVAVIGFGLMLAVMVAGGVLGYLNVRRLAESDQKVAHTHEVIGGLESLPSTLTAAETGQRGYLLTEDEKYLQPYDDALRRVEATVARLKELTSDNPDQQARLAVLGQEVAVRLDELRRAVALMKGGDRPAALKVVRSSEGKALMGGVREAVAAMRRAEEDLLRRRAAESEASFRTTVLSEALTALTGVALLGVVFYLSQRNLLIRQRAAEVLAGQRERLRVTLASIGDAVITTDTEGRVTYLNAVAESLTGWKSDEAVGQPLDAVFRIVNEQTRKSAEDPAKRALREGAIVGLVNHTALIARDGTERPIDDRAAPITDGQGHVVGCVLTFRDFTARRKAEEDLRRSEEQVRSVVNTVIDGIITVDQGGTVETFNPAAERIFGYTASEVIGQNVKMLMPEPYHHEHGNNLANDLRTGEAKITGIGREVVGRRKDGSTFPMDLAVSEFRINSRRCFTGVVRDITERKRAEAVLRESESQFRQLAGAMPQIVWTARPDGHIDYYNERWYEYTGFPRGEYGETSWEPILHPDDLRRCKDTYYGCIKAEKPYQIEYRFKDRRTGGYRWFLGRAVPVRDEQGRIVRWFGTCTDIADTKRAEEALREADRRKNEFLATLAHELRNPLAPIRNAAQILKMKGPADADLRWGQEVIDRQVRQMARLLDDLLDVPRIAHNKLELRKERVELAAVIRSAMETSRPLIDGGGHDLTTALPPQPVYLDGDPVRLAQVFANLLNNAAKYTEAGGHIGLTAERQGSDVVVSVRDDGIGIAAEMLPRLFDIFSQAKPALERSQGGLGIGLSLVRGLVELHGGRVEARSEGPGRGSEFIVRLPVVVEKVGQEPRPRGEGGEQPCVTKRRLLVVDDLKDSADSLAMMLKLLGHKVHTAYDGEEAVAAAARFRPEVVLLDIGMPKLNGYEACRRIREQPWGGGMFLVAVTGWGQEEDRRRTEEAGFNHHMVKPVDPAALMRLLAELQPARQ